MPIDFDYQGFAQNLTNQAQEAIPEGISDQNKQFLIQVIFDFATKAGEALVHEDNSLMTPESVQMVIQFIAEWTFHKGLELMGSEIPPENWLFILQTIAAGIFEAGKKSMIGGLDTTTTTTIIQGEVDSHFTHAMNLLKEEGKITDEQIESIYAAQQQAHQQLAAQQKQEQQPQQPVQQLSPKEAKLATIAVLLSSLPAEKSEAIIESFSPEDATLIRNMMQPENLNVQLDPAQTAKLLKSLRETIAPEQAPTVVAKHIQGLVSQTDPVNIIKLLQKERPAVQNYVKSCIEGKFIRRNFSPYLAKIIYKYIEKQLYSA